MKIVLLKSIPKVGNKGDIVDVSDGYAKNALIAKKLAIVATPAHIREWERRKQKDLAQKQERKKAMQDILPLLEKYTFEFNVKTGDKGAVFTSIHEEDIKKSVAKFLHEKNALFDTEDVHVELKPIKELGEKTIPIRLGRGEDMVKTEIKITIIGISGQ